MQRFLQGMHTMDEHFRTAPLRDNLPALLGLLNVRGHVAGSMARRGQCACCPDASVCLLSHAYARTPTPSPAPLHSTPPLPPLQVWNTTFLGHSTTALLPYQQALQHFAPHIQQLSMESNGKGVALDGSRLPYETGARAGGVAGVGAGRGLSEHRPCMAGGGGVHTALLLTRRALQARLTLGSRAPMGSTRSTSSSTRRVGSGGREWGGTGQLLAPAGGVTARRGAGSGRAQGRALARIRQLPPCLPPLRLLRAASSLPSSSGWCGRSRMCTCRRVEARG